MAVSSIPKRLRVRYRFDERRHASAILATDFRSEWRDLLDCLDAFTLRRSEILAPGGARSPIPNQIDGFLQEPARGWAEKSFEVKIIVDGEEYPTPTHKIDNVKNRVGVEVEWNNKTEFYDRDLNNFRLLHQLEILSVGVIITRQSELQQLFNDLGKGKSYGASTTHWDKLIPKIDGGGAGGATMPIRRRPIRRRSIRRRSIRRRRSPAVCRIVRTIFQIRVHFIAPARPSRDMLASEEFQVGSGATALDQIENLLWLTAVFTLSRADNIYLTAARVQRPHLAANTEEQKLRHIAEIEADAPSVRSAILADLVPNDVRFVLKAPGLHHCETFSQ